METLLKLEPALLSHLDHWLVIYWNPQNREIVREEIIDYISRHPESIQTMSWNKIHQSAMAEKQEKNI